MLNRCLVAVWLALFAPAAALGQGAGPAAPIKTSSSASEPAASVIAASGDTALLRASSLSAPVRVGAQLGSGDRLLTRDDGRITLRFADGAVVALQPRTEFRIDDYRFDQAQQRSFLTLVRGALRTVSGAIGKRSRDDYRLSTPTATIGIRGTEFELAETSCPPRGCAAGERAGLKLRVHQGAVVVSSAGASLEVPTGAGVMVADRGSAPQRALVESFTPPIEGAGERPAPGNNLPAAASGASAPGAGVGAQDRGRTPPATAAPERPTSTTAPPATPAREPAPSPWVSPPAGAAANPAAGR